MLEGTLRVAGRFSQSCQIEVQTWIIGIELYGNTHFSNCATKIAAPVQQVCEAITCLRLIGLKVQCSL